MFLSFGCGVLLNEFLPYNKTQQNVEFNVYFQAFYSPNLKDICKEKLGGEFDIDNLEKVSVDIEINGQSAHFDDLLEGSNNITPQITIEKKKNASIVGNIKVTYSLRKDEFAESTEVTLEYFYSFSELNLLDKEKVFLIFYLVDENDDAKIMGKILYDSVISIKDISDLESQKIHYINNGYEFFSVFKNESVNGIVIEKELEENNIYTYPIE